MDWQWMQAGRPHRFPCKSCMPQPAHEAHLPPARGERDMQEKRT